MLSSMHLDSREVFVVDSGRDHELLEYAIDGCEAAVDGLKIPSLLSLFLPDHYGVVIIAL